jgi:hypothetical protein
VIPAAIQAPTIAQLCELLSTSVSLKAMTLPTLVSVALARVIIGRVCCPTIAETFPSLGNTRFVTFPSRMIKD